MRVNEYQKKRRAGLRPGHGGVRLRRRPRECVGGSRGSVRVGVAQRGSLQWAGVGGLPLGFGRTRMQLVLASAKGRLYFR